MDAIARILILILFTATANAQHRRLLIAGSPSSSGSFSVVTSNMIAWYKADAQTYSDGDPIATLNDSWTNNFDLLAVTTQRPTFKTGIQNGLPVIRFDGSGNRIGITAIVWTGFPAIHIVTVCKVAAYNAYDMVFSGTDGGTYTELRESVTPDKMEGVAGIGSALAESTQSITANFDVWGYTFVDATDGIEVFYYETLTGTNNQAGASVTIANFFMGGRNASGYFEGDIAEMLVYSNRLTQAEITNVMQYLTNKWNLSH